MLQADFLDIVNIRQAIVLSGQPQRFQK